MTSGERSFVIGIAGGSGSGKTTLCRRLAEGLGEQSLMLSCDQYYHCLSHLPAAERTQANFDHPDSIDFLRLAKDLQHLATGTESDVPEYCFVNHVRLPDSTTLTPRPLVFVEGVLLFTHAEVREQLDLALFVEADSEVRFQRRLQRDQSDRGRSSQSVKAQWEKFVAPMHEQFVAPSQQFADLTLRTDRSNKMGEQVLLEGLRSLVAK